MKNKPKNIQTTSQSHVEDQTLTYKELNEQANQLAHFLKKQGAAPEQFVTLSFKHSLDLIIGLLGIIKTGAAYVPLDPDYPIERIAHILTSSRAKLILTEKEYLSRFSSIKNVSIICLDLIQPQLLQEKKTNLAISALSQNLMYVIYTSGTTGQPKGVCCHHAGVVNLVTEIHARQPIIPGDNGTLWTSICFDGSILEIFSVLLFGGNLHLLNDNVRYIKEDFYSYITNNKIASAYFPPHVLGDFLNYISTHDTVLKRLIAGVETISEKTLISLRDRIPGVEILYGYGPTEDAVAATFYKMPQTEDGSHKIAPIGKPIRNTHILILDKYLRPVPIGVNGELYIGGVGLARGYLNRPDLTAERFIANPYATESDVKQGIYTRLYKTGDLCRWLPDGNISFTGRVDHQIKLRGLRIELGEIEANLVNHSAIKEAVVLLREDAPGDRRLVAYYTINEKGVVATTTDLKNYLNQYIPDYMMPSAFVKVDVFPLTTHGKLDRQVLPIPKFERLTYVAPGSELEKNIAAIWQEILHQEQIGITDNFFELGGHSLLAMQVVSRIREKYQIELSLQQLFKTPTIKNIALYLEKACKNRPYEEIPIVSRDTKIPLSFAQQRLWFLDQLEPGNTQYNIPMTLRISGHLDIKALEEAINNIVARHEVLRTAFITVDDKAVQHISSTLHIPLHYVEMDSEAEAKASVDEDVHRGFDLSQAPLLRASLFKFAPDSYLFLVNIHHSVFDGWSMTLFAKELGLAYKAALTHSLLPLAPLPIQYADFSVWQRNCLSEDNAIYQKQMSYWQQQLEGSPTLLELPTDRPRMAMQSHVGDSIYFTLSHTLTEQLKGLANQQQTTLFITLLSAFYVLLYRYSGQEDIVIGSAIANRNREELEHLLGFFVNTLALRAKLKADMPFTELLALTNRRAVEAYDNQDIPFERLVDELKIERSLSHSPLFQVMFVSQRHVNTIPKLSGLSVEEEPLDYRIATFDLTLNLNETDEDIQGILEYRTALFDRATMERLITHFEILVQGIVAHPDYSIAELPLLSPEENEQIVVTWNDTNRDFSRDKTIHQLFEEQVNKTPNNVAVIYEDNQLTYCELNKKANQLAHQIIARHQEVYNKQVMPDTLIAVSLNRGLNMIITILAVLKAGAAYIPIDPDYPRDRIQLLLDDAKPHLFIVEKEMTEKISFAANRVINSHNKLTTDTQENSKNPINEVSADNLAYVIYTSGSTGIPKGVMIEHGKALNTMRAINDKLHVGSADVILALSAYNFDLSVYDMLGALITGAKFVLLKHEFEKEPKYWLELMMKHKVTIWNSVPALMQLLIDHMLNFEEEINYQPSLKSVRCILLSGDWFRPL